MATSSGQSVSHQVTKGSSSNLAIAFFPLPREKRSAMTALYAFCRCVDDIADNVDIAVEERKNLLEEWQQSIRNACADPSFSSHLPVIAELTPWIHRYQLSFEDFNDLIEGMHMDLNLNRYSTWNDLEKYCYRVASTVGLLSIRIFGFQVSSARRYAFHLGQALQLTNILRDIRDDAMLQRIYLPLELLSQLNISETEVIECRIPETKLTALVEEMFAVASKHYQAAREALSPLDRPNMITSEMMANLYWRLLKKIKSRPRDLLHPKKVKLSKTTKFSVMMQSVFFHRWSLRSQSYG